MSLSAPQGTTLEQPVAEPAGAGEPPAGRAPRRLARGLVIAAVAAAAVAAPWLMPAVSVNILSGVLVYAIVALSLNVLIGYTGQISLGHAAFLGAGAFAAGLALTELGLPWLAAQAVAVVVGGMLALVLGFVALRVTGLYLALVTLAFGVFAYEALFNLPLLSGGGGMPAPRPAWASADIAYAYVCLAALAGVWVLDWRLTSSRAGRAIQALRDSEQVAASWGISVTAHKLLAFVLSGALAGLAGGLFASIEQLVSRQTFGFQLSLTFVLMVVIGGAGSRIGVVIGALLLAGNSFVLDQLADAFEDFPVDGSAAQLVGALLLLIVLLWVPGGIAQLLRGPLAWLRGEPRAGDGEG